MRVTSFLVASAFGVLTSFQTGVSATFDDSSSLQNILKNTDKGAEYQYPTDFTRDIFPKPCHSHNDYWRNRPVYSAIAAGCISIEADVFLINGSLYVGHDKSSLSEKRTLKSLYIDQLLQILKRQNPKTRFVQSPTRYGVYDTDTSQTLYLFIDIKGDGYETWKYVTKELQPLRDLNYLTKVTKDGTKVPGPITVIGTGGTPLDLVAGLETRDYFYDAPLADLAKFDNITSSISPIASTSLMEAIGKITSDEEPFNSTQLETLRSQIKLAKSRGIGARYWEAPLWPIRTRNAIWRALLKEGVALLNVDDLNAVGKYF